MEYPDVTHAFDIHPLAYNNITDPWHCRQISCASCCSLNGAGRVNKITRVRVDLQGCSQAVQLPSCSVYCFTTKCACNNHANSFLCVNKKKSLLNFIIRFLRLSGEYSLFPTSLVDVCETVLTAVSSSTCWLSKWPWGHLVLSFTKLGFNSVGRGDQTEIKSPLCVACGWALLTVFYYSGGMREFDAFI